MCQKFLDLGYAVTGIDNLNSYYDVALKNARVDILSKRNGFRFERSEIAEAQAVSEVFANAKPDYVVHLAAQQEMLAWRARRVAQLRGDREVLSHLSARPSAHLKPEELIFFVFSDASNSTSHSLPHIVSPPA